MQTYQQIVTFSDHTDSGLPYLHIGMTCHLGNHRRQKSARNLSVECRLWPLQMGRLPQSRE